MSASPFGKDLEHRRLLGAGNEALRRGDFESAIGFLRSALDLAPNDALTLARLGLLYQRTGRFHNAKETFLAAVRLDRNEPLAVYGLGLSLAASREFEDAERLLRRSISLAPDNVGAYEELSRVLTSQRRLDEALDVLRAAIVGHPESSELQDALGARLEERGDLEGAMQAYRRSVELMPIQGQSYCSIAFAKKIGPEDRHLLDTIRSVLQRRELPPDQAAKLFFALGKAHNDLEEYGEAMACWRNANAITDRQFVNERAFSPDQTLRLFSGLVRTFTRETIEAPREAEPASPRPIFIVGMMRSGTTLVEQILSRHPAVAAAGELEFWPREFFGLVDWDSMKLKERQALEAGKRYLELLRGVADGAPNVTDKLPENFRIVGMLRSIFPNAVFIHSRRHAVDTCLSIFGAPLGIPADYSRDPKKLVFMYSVYLKIMEHWKTVLPEEALIEIRYERLVAEPEATTRRLLEFLGLPWDEACLTPEQGDRAVLTASSWQVRQPVYTSSVERWRNFEPWLGEFAELLNFS